MTSEYVRFAPARRLAEYRGQPGHEASGQMLSFAALDALAHAVSTRTEPEFVVIGETRYEDGRRYLELAVTTGHIEATTDHRWDPNAKSLRVLCPSCDTWDGKHTKSCDR